MRRFEIDSRKPPTSEVAANHCRRKHSRRLSHVFLVGLMPRALILTGDLREPHGVFLRSATDAIFICCFSYISAALADKIYLWVIDDMKSRTLWKHPVPHFLYFLFSALEEVSKLTDC